jgi:hypothetical protein
MSEAGIVVVGDLWHERLNELTYVARSIAGAASRWEQVTVLAPGPRGGMQPDGAFDVEGIGEHGEYQWPDRLSSDCVVVVDHLAPGVVDLLTKVAPRAVFYLAAHGDGHDPSWQRIHLTADPKLGGPFVKAYIPVNPLAELHRHNGFGFTGYQLVLSGRTGVNEEPPPAVAWLTSAFHDSYVVVVENAVASAWKGRALRGEVTVDTRMDLWRLIAHANVCIDLAPGQAIARECIESLRFGTPIVVPEDAGAAVAHAAAGGGSTFADPQQLLEAAASMQVGATRSQASRDGRHYADANYGAPEEFMASLRALLADA